MQKKSFFTILGAVLFLSTGATAFAGYATCEARRALNAKDIVLKPGETQTFTYDFRDPGCADTRYDSIWAYLGDAAVAVSGCTNSIGRNAKLEMVLTDLTTGVVAAKVSSSSVILNDPTSGRWGGYVVTGHLLELKITLDPGVKKCMNANLRFAFGEGSF